ncbi:hypothetical protein [Bradyrhizobium sp.]|jgi:hypothetical protein|uniref:hypothetical protein n=1 Tax=Bradyrhizobium sp. TaxID=376 RepID=UPI003C3CADC0
MSRAATKSVFAVILFLAGAVPCVAQVQPGSTGGSIGKTDKSISGGEGAAEPRAPAKLRSNSRRPTDGSARSKVFENPTINGIRVDGCMKWGPVGCGSPAANHWCRSKGFRQATSWDTEKIHPTIFQDPESPVKVCDYFFCGAFSRVVCE